MNQPKVKYKINSNWIEKPCRSIIWGNDGKIEAFTCFSGDIEYKFTNHFNFDRYFNMNGNIEAFLLFH